MVMSCHRPLTGWYSKEINEKTGLRSLVFEHTYAFEKDMPLEVACKQCNGCLMDRSDDWKVRLYGESLKSNDNFFITYTFSDEELHKRKNPLSVDKRDMQLFNMRLRKKIRSENPHKKSEEPEEFKKWNDEMKLKFYQVWEYGHLEGRPHYHSIHFNVPYFDDLVLYSEGKQGDKLYTSKKLDELWGFGLAVIGEVNMKTISYTTNYLTGSKYGDKADEYYSRTDLETGEVYQVEKEGSSMSQGLGADFYQDYRSDMYPKDFLTIDGRKMKLPGYFDRLEAIEDDIRFDDIKEKRIEGAMKFSADNTEERRAVIAECAERKKSARSFRDFRDVS